MSAPLFHRAHYNIIAAQIRREIEKFGSAGISTPRGTLVDFALSMAKRLNEDNPLFDPIKFLEACSPDNDRYPITELWED